MKIEIINRKYWINQIQTKRAIKIKCYQYIYDQIIKKTWHNFFFRSEIEIAFAKSDLIDAKNYYITLENALKSDYTKTIYLTEKEYKDLS